MPIIPCPKCGAKNRVDDRAETLQPVCGRCGTPLRAGGVGSGKPLVVTDATFARDVLGSGAVPVLLDCWAPWCGPCRMVAPVMDELAAEAGGRYVVAKLNTDENPGVAGQFRIDAIPTMLLFKDGKLVDRIVGLAPKPTIAQKLSSYL